MENKSPGTDEVPDPAMLDGVLRLLDLRKGAAANTSPLPSISSGEAKDEVWDEVMAVAAETDMVVEALISASMMGLLAEDS